MHHGYGRRAEYLGSFAQHCPGNHGHERHSGNSGHSQVVSPCRIPASLTGLPESRAARHAPKNIHHRP